MKAKYIWVLAALLCAVACGSDDSGQAGAEPVKCGTLTCSGTEMCVVPRPVDPWFEGPESHSCEPIPPGCEGLKLCGCSALEGDYRGLAIVGCSLLGERSIYVADVTCGDRRCTGDEFCLVEAQSFGGPVTARGCQPLPAACQDGSKFCGADGCMSGTPVDAGQVTGCVESDFVRAIIVDAS